MSIGEEEVAERRHDAAEEAGQEWRKAKARCERGTMVITLAGFGALAWYGWAASMPILIVWGLMWLQLRLDADNARRDYDHAVLRAEHAQTEVLIARAYYGLRDRIADIEDNGDRP